MFLMWQWLLMLLPFALWGTAMAAMAPLVHSGGPEIVASFRLLPAGFVLLIAVILLGRNWRVSSKDLGWFLLFTVIDGALFQIFLARGLSETGAGLGSVLIDSQPLMVALLARVFFGNEINPIGWIGLVLGLVGIICLGVPPDFLKHWWLIENDLPLTNFWNLGEVWMLAAAISMALGTVIIRFACRHSDPIAVTGWHMVIGGVPLFVWHIFDANWPLWPHWTNLEWGLMGYASLFGSALAYGLFFWFANRAELTSFSTLTFLTPVFAIASGGVWLGERLQFLQWIGVVLVLVSVLLVSQRRRLWEADFFTSKILDG